MIKAGIFDLDGTLAYTLDSMAYIANEVMKKLGLRPLPLDNFRYYCGEGADMLVRRALKEAGKAIKIQEDFVTEYENNPGGLPGLAVRTAGRYSCAWEWHRRRAPAY